MQGAHVRFKTLSSACCCTVVQPSLSTTTPPTHYAFAPHTDSVCFLPPPCGCHRPLWLSPPPPSPQILATLVPGLHHVLGGGQHPGHAGGPGMVCMRACLRACLRVHVCVCMNLKAWIGSCAGWGPGHSSGVRMAFGRCIPQSSGSGLQAGVDEQCTCPQSPQSTCQLAEAPPAPPWHACYPYTARPCMPPHLTCCSAVASNL